MRRLQRMDVEVRRLTAPLAVPDYTPYGRAARSTTLPAGTYWVTMGQRQKHWVQAMLNEDPYTTTFLISNPGEKVGDEHPFAPQLGVALRRAKAPVVMYRAP